MWCFEVALLHALCSSKEQDQEVEEEEEEEEKEQEASNIRQRGRSRSRGISRQNYMMGYVENLYFRFLTLTSF